MLVFINCLCEGLWLLLLITLLFYVVCCFELVCLRVLCVLLDCHAGLLCDIYFVTFFILGYCVLVVLFLLV